MKDDQDMLYTRELKKRKTKIKEDIKALEQFISNTKEVDDDFIKAYKRLNNLRIDVKIVNSRIYNYGKPRSGIEEFKIPNNI